MYRIHGRRPTAWGLSLALGVAAAFTGLAQTAWAHPAPDASPVAVGAAHPAGAHRLGALSGSRPLKVSVALQPRDQAALNALVAAVADPYSPHYRHFLTPRQYNAMFAPSTAQLHQVEGWLRSQGLTVTGNSGNRQVVTATATAAKAAKAFDVSLGQYQGANGSHFFAPDTKPVVPASLGGVVRAVTGLSDQSGAQRDSGVTTATTAPAARPNGPAGPGGGYTPAQLAKAYTLTGLTGSYNGSGETVGLVEFDGFNQSDVNGWASEFGLSGMPDKVVPVDGGISSVSDPLEADMDIDAVATFAPKASQLVYEAPNTDAGFTDEMARIASDDSINVLSTSWGDGESCTSSSVLAAAHDSFNQLSLQGVTLFSASGDRGQYGCAYAGNLTPQQQYPSADPLFTSVGGTSLSTSDSAGTYSGESVWNNSDSNTANDRSGGGPSNLYAKPSWQPGSGTARMVPDVSLVADYEAGALSVLYNGNWTSAGGTSLASPLWAGYTALLDQKGGKDLGQINPTLYGLAAGSSYGSYFHDVTKGDNGTYSAGPGYDMATGLGSFQGDALGAALLGGVTPPPPTTDFGVAVSPSSGSVTVGSSATATVSVSAGSKPPSSVALTASGAPSGVSVSFSPSSVAPGSTAKATITTAGSTTPGTYGITITGTAGSATHTAVYSLTVAAKGGTQPTLANPGAQYSYQNKAISLALKAAGGTAPYRWSASGLPSGLAINSSTGVISGMPTKWGNLSPSVTVTDATGKSATVSFNWTVFIAS
ncbi:protease pro-enzyme activation domain-containing protein [Streptantibioticus parmotrematis]|uniref:protease pro-enzyme activation domain-containing protein n=1 Tax=Streptantibioticus parmotrematis TaxID=2873249 RepID=UPI0033DD882F